MSALSLVNDELRGIAVGEERRTRDHEAEVARFKSEKQQLESNVADSRDAIQKLEVRLEHEAIDREEERQKLNLENEALRLGIDELQARVEFLEQQMEREAVEVHRELKAKLNEVEDERDGHAQRLRFLGEALPVHFFSYPLYHPSHPFTCL